MIKIDNIGNLKKCRIWLEELPSTKCKVIEVLSSILETSNSMNRNNQSIAVELFVAPRYYALLGIEYIYKGTNNLEICINITEDTEKITDSLALPSDNVHSGISNEYAQTILNASIKVFGNLNNVPSGVLTFNIGGYGDYGSNQVIFAKATSILIRLLVGTQGNIDLEELKNIVRNELDKTLTDI
jgi:hypothetical protein